MNTRMIYIVDYLKVFACFLIINFHSDILFPDKFAIFAFGGDIGNNIFFMVSGFTLYPSIEENDIHQIGKWYRKRLKKLLPLLSVFYIASMIVGDVRIHEIKDIINFFIFPTIYWFTGAILLFYPLLFIVKKICPPFVQRLGFMSLLILHLLFDGIEVERYFIGFIAMAIGCNLRGYFQRRNILFRKKQLVFLYNIPLVWIMYILLKLFQKKGVHAFGLIHLGIGILTICIAMLFLAWGYINDKKIEKFSLAHPRIYSIIHTLSWITLATYLVQSFHDRMILRFIQIYVPFPASYIFSLIVVIIFALIISMIDRFFQKWWDYLWRYNIEKGDTGIRS